MALVVQEEPFICFLSVDTGFKAAVDFDDFHANEWQSIVGCYFHRKLIGGWASLRHASKLVASGGHVPESACRPQISNINLEACFSSIEHMNVFAISGPNAGLEIALSWSAMRLKILRWRPDFHDWSPAGD